MDTLLAWALFGLVVWVALAVQTHQKKIGEGRVPGPVWCIAQAYRTYREAGEPDTDSDEKEEDTKAGQGRRSSRGVDNLQDTAGHPAGHQGGHDPDMAPGHDRTRVSPAVTRHRPARPARVQRPCPAVALQPSRTVTPELPLEVPPRVITHIVQPGSWLGDVRGADSAGRPVVIRYQLASGLAAPLGELNSPASGEEGEDGTDPVVLDEVALRQDWLRAMDADARFTNAEVAVMYQQKWRRGPKTLKRDRELIMNSKASAC